MVDGTWYDANDVDSTINALTDELGTLGYAFVNIRPKVNLRREERAVDVTFQVAQGARVHVERIEIEGNVRTLDEVIEAKELEATACSRSALPDALSGRSTDKAMVSTTGGTRPPSWRVPLCLALFLPLGLGLTWAARPRRT